MRSEYTFDWKEHGNLDDSLLSELSALFSNHYGFWGANGPNPGDPIKLSANKIREFIPEGGWVVLARQGRTLVGYALGLRKDVPNFGQVNWVTQLVVHKDHRNEEVAKDLLFTFWGFSDHFAWGLVTSNPFSVRALERITARRCAPILIKARREALEIVGAQIPYIVGRPLQLEAERSVIDTAFQISHKRLPDKMAEAVKKAPWQLGTISEGEEWFAFTFREQTPTPLTREELSHRLDRSEKTAILAYERMQIGPRHAWARSTEHEVMFAVRTLGIAPTTRVLDLGCGRGRHALALARLGMNVLGVDFVPSFVAEARSGAASERLSSVRFEEGDARDVNAGLGQFDAALCLYDVVGTFPDDRENQRIIENIARHLRPGGRALISVLNMELTQHIATNVAVIAQDPAALQRVLPSTLMRESGNIFDPARFLLDSVTHVVYRKEQFEGDGRPPGELIVRDRRYTREELRMM